MAQIPNFSIDFEQVVMDALLHRDDVPIEIILNKSLKDTASKIREVEYIKSLRQ